MDNKSVEANLEAIVDQEFAGGVRWVHNVSIISKNGLKIAGKASQASRTETFAAMSAVMFSAAGATRSASLKDGVDYMLVVFRNSKLIILELTSGLLLAATAERDTGDADVLRTMTNISDRIKAEMPWIR